MLNESHFVMMVVTAAGSRSPLVHYTLGHYYKNRILLDTRAHYTNRCVETMAHSTTNRHEH